MNRIWKRALGAGIIVMLILAVRSKAQDRAGVVPGMKVLLENDCVRVQYHDVAVGETIAMHSHPNYVVYALTPFKARIRLKDGSLELTRFDGHVVKLRS